MEIPALGYNSVGWLVVKPALKPKTGGASNKLQVKVGAGFPSCWSKMQLAGYGKTTVQTEMPVSQGDS